MAGHIESDEREKPTTQITALFSEKMLGMISNFFEFTKARFMA